MPKKVSMTNLGQLATQTNAGVAFMSRYAAYARQIGCTVDGDSIQATSTQSKLLRTWWDQNSKGNVGEQA